MSNVKGRRLGNLNKDTKALIDLITNCKRVLAIEADTVKGVLYFKLEYEDGSVKTRRAYLLNHYHGSGKLSEELKIECSNFSNLANLETALENPQVEWTYSGQHPSRVLDIELRHTAPGAKVKQTFTLESGIHTELRIELMQG